MQTLLIAYETHCSRWQTTSPGFKEEIKELMSFLCEFFEIAIETISTHHFKTYFIRPNCPKNFISDNFIITLPFSLSPFHNSFSNQPHLVPHSPNTHLLNLIAFQLHDTLLALFDVFHNIR